MCDDNLPPSQLQRELSRMQSSLSEQQDRGLRQREEMSQRLQEKELTIVAQREQVSSSHAPLGEGGGVRWGTPDLSRVASLGHDDLEAVGRWPWTLSWEVS